MILIGLSVAALASCGGARPSVEPALAPTPGWRVRHYVVDLVLTEDAEGPSVYGRERVAVDVHGTQAVQLDAVGMSIAELGCSVPCDWSYDGRVIAVAFGAPVDGSALLAITYDARPSMGMEASAGAVWTAFHTWHWMPTTIDPSQRATLELHVAGPAGTTVVATGDGPDAPGPDAVSTTPYPSYLYGFVAGDLAPARLDAGGTTLEAWAPTGARGLTLALDRTAAALGRWSRAMQRPFFLDRYTTVFVPGRAAQELAGMAIVSADYLDVLAADPDEDWLLVHELVHQEWGNLVTCATWGDFWINESIAVWWVTEDKRLRGDGEGQVREEGLWRERLDAALAEGRDPRVERPGVSVEDAGGTVVYHGGALVIAEVARTLGEGAFASILSRWIGDAVEDEGLALSTDAFVGSWGLSIEERSAALRRLGR